MQARQMRRVAGVLAARLPEARFANVPDSRREHGRRWSLAPMLGAVVVGCAVGLKSLADLETLTRDLSAPMRRLLRIPRRLPDTTLRDALCALEPDALAPSLHAVCRAAHRRKALEPFGLPFGVVAIDGKGTACTSWDDEYAQLQPHTSDLGASGIVRTLTCALVSSRVKVCLDAVPIPADTNEMGSFADAFERLHQTYGACGLFKLVTADAGMCSEANARLVREHGYHYLLRVKSTQPTLFAEAKRLLGSLPVAYAVEKTVDTTGEGTTTRYLFVTEEMTGYEWEHLRTVVRVHCVKRDRDGKLVALTDDERDRYYLSSLPQARLTRAQWLYLVRKHWAVENECHNTFDKFFEEDRHPWIEADPKGMLAVMLLRRIAYNILALFRGVTQRSDEKRQTPWRQLMQRFYNVLIAAAENHVAGLRARSQVGAGA